MSFLKLMSLKAAEWNEVGEELAISKLQNRGITRFRATIPSQSAKPEDAKALTQASLYAQQNQNINIEADENTAIPLESQMVSREFRALSADLLQSRGLDFRSPGVLNEGVKLLEGKPVFPNHNFWDINNTLGVVAKTYWDSTGANSEGVPGINCEIKIDALMNIRIARGLMMQPPSINRMSLTILFEFEYSHPKLVDDHNFWRMIGEEVDGEIVRLIVTKIIDIWEASLVFLGEDRKAKGLPTSPNNDDDDDDESLSAKLSAETDDIQSPQTPNEEKTMKLTKEQMQALGITTEELSESEILEKALEFAKTAKEFDSVNLADLQEKAKVSDEYTELQRTEVRRLAKLAELGAEDGELDEVIESSIKEASFDRLKSLQTYYEKKAAERFPDSRRSSMENSEEVEGAGGVNPKAKQTVPAVGLH